MRSVRRRFRAASATAGGAGPVHRGDDALGLLLHRAGEVRIDHVLALHRGLEPSRSSTSPSAIVTRLGSEFPRRLARRRYSVSFASVSRRNTRVVFRASCPFAPRMRTLGMVPLSFTRP